MRKLTPSSNVERVKLTDGLRNVRTMELQPRRLYAELASAIQARENCAQHAHGDLANHLLANPSKAEWFCKWNERISDLVDNFLPSGSGFDNGTDIDLVKSNASRIVLTTAFHHMDESGGYDGWTSHTVIVTPSFSGIDIRVTGRNRNDIKNYIGETFAYELETLVRFDVDKDAYQRVESMNPAAADVAAIAQHEADADAQEMSNMPEESGR